MPIRVVPYDPDWAVRFERKRALLRLAQQHGDEGAGYTSHKRAFVARVLAPAGIALTPRPGPHGRR